MLFLHCLPPLSYQPARSPGPDSAWGPVILIVPCADRTGRPQCASNRAKRGARACLRIYIRRRFYPGHPCSRSHRASGTTLRARNSRVESPPSSRLPLSVLAQVAPLGTRSTILGSGGVLFPRRPQPPESAFCGEAERLLPWAPRTPPPFPPRALFPPAPGVRDPASRRFSSPRPCCEFPRPGALFLPGALRGGVILGAPPPSTKPKGETGRTQSKRKESQHPSAKNRSEQSQPRERKEYSLILLPSSSSATGWESGVRRAGRRNLPAQEDDGYPRPPPTATAGGGGRALGVAPLRGIPYYIAKREWGDASIPPLEPMASSLPPPPHPRKTNHCAYQTPMSPAPRCSNIYLAYPPAHPPPRPGRTKSSSPAPPAPPPESSRDNNQQDRPSLHPRPPPPPGAPPASQHRAPPPPAPPVPPRPSGAPGSRFLPSGRINGDKCYAPQKKRKTLLRGLNKRRDRPLFSFPFPRGGAALTTGG